MKATRGFVCFIVVLMLWVGYGCKSTQHTLLIFGLGRGVEICSKGVAAPIRLVAYFDDYTNIVEGADLVLKLVVRDGSVTTMTVLGDSCGRLDFTFLNPIEVPVGGHPLNAKNQEVILDGLRKNLLDAWEEMSSRDKRFITDGDRTAE